MNHLLGTVLNLKKYPFTDPWDWYWFTYMNGWFKWVFNVGKYTILWEILWAYGFSGSITCTYTTPEVDPKGWWNCVITTFPPKPKGNLKTSRFITYPPVNSGGALVFPHFKEEIGRGIITWNPEVQNGWNIILFSHGMTSKSLPNTVRFTHLSTQLIVLRRKKKRDIERKHGKKSTGIQG